MFIDDFPTGNVLAAYRSRTLILEPFRIVCDAHSKLTPVAAQAEIAAAGN
jgi:hypothetical protein